MTAPGPNLTQSRADWLTRYQYGLLAVIVIAGAVLRFYKLGEWSFWIDEIFTIDRAQSHYDPLTFFRYWVPLSIMLEAQAFQLFGIDEFSARLVPALVGIITLPVFYFVIRDYFGTSVALLASLFLAVAPWHIEWSQNARFYSSLLLFYNLALFAFFYAIEKDRPGYLLLSGLLAFFAIRERSLAILLAPVIALYLFLITVLPFQRPVGLNKRNLLIIILPAVLALLADLLNFILRGQSLIAEALDIFWGIPIDSPARIVILVLFNIGVPIAALGFFGGLVLSLGKSRVGLLFLLSAVVPVIVLAALNPFMFTVDRYVFMTLPSWIVLASVAVNELLRILPRYHKLIALGVVFMLVGDAAGANLLYFHANQGNRVNWAGSFALVEREKEVDDVIVTTWPEIGQYYTNDTMVAFDEVAIADIERSNHRWWFVYDSQSVWLFNENQLKPWIEANAELIDLQYLRVREGFHIQVYLYKPTGMSQIAQPVAVGSR